MNRSGNRRPHRFLAACLVVIQLAAFLPWPAFAAERIPSDTYFSSLWYLKQIGATEAWNRSLGFEGIPIAIIDSGVDLDHPDLKDNIWRNYGEIPNNGIDDDGNGYVDDVYGWDFVDNDNDPRPKATGEYNKLGVNHGTVNAGIAAAKGDNGKGVVGVTWQSTIMAIRVLDSSGAGDPQNVVRAVEYAVKNGAKVINLSFAGPSRNELLAIALRRAYDAGVFIVAAAGNAPEGGAANDLDRNPLYPICLDQGSDENFVFGVAATDESDVKAEFSNFGAGCVDIAAPGTRVLTTQYYRAGSKDFDALYGGYYNGTSVAAPIVAGAVALLRALDRNLTPKQIMNILTDSAFRIDPSNPGYFGKIGRGRLDIAKAVGRLAESMVSRTATPPSTTSSLLPAGSDGRLVVAAAGPGRAAEIRLFTSDGLFIRGFNAFAEGFRGGVSLAIGDFDGAGRRSIVAGAGPGGGPQVRIFDSNTKLLGGFLAFDQRFTGGVSVAAGDIDGDGRDEIIAGAGPGGGPHVRIFRANGAPIGGFFAFNKTFRGGVSVAAGDIDGDGRDEIITASGPGQTTAVRVFNPKGELKSETKPFGARYQDGSRLSVVRDGSGSRDLIVVGPRRGTAYGVLTIDASGRTAAASKATAALVRWLSAGVGHPLTLAGQVGSAPLVVIESAKDAAAFYAFEPAFKGGVAVGLIR
ncbi:MAG: S8 family serine peptidase [Patescibacteria group bacterium]